MADGTITLWQQPNGMWRWRWEPDVEGSGTVLVSHRPYDTLEEAEETAREAYPQARVEVPDPETDTPKSRPRRWVRWAGVLLVVVLLAVVVRWLLTRRRTGSADRPASGRPRGSAGCRARERRARGRVRGRGPRA